MEGLCYFENWMKYMRIIVDDFPKKGQYPSFQYFPVFWGDKSEEYLEHFVIKYDWYYFNAPFLIDISGTIMHQIRERGFFYYYLDEGSLLPLLDEVL